MKKELPPMVATGDDDSPDKPDGKPDYPRSLISLTTELEQIIADLDATDGEITDEALAIRLDAMPGAIAQKVENVTRMIRHFELLANMGSEEVKRIRGLAQRYENAAQRLEGYLFACVERLQATGHPMPIRTPTAAVNVVNNGGRPTIRWTRSIEELPDDFARLVPARIEVDLDAAYEWYKIHGTLPEGFTVERGRRLSIR